MKPLSLSIQLKNFKKFKQKTIEIFGLLLRELYISIPASNFEFLTGIFTFFMFQFIIEELYGYMTLT